MFELGYLTWILTLLFLGGVSCNTCSVAYRQQLICATKGSSVVILCSFHPLDSLEVDAVLWGHFWSLPTKGRMIFNSNSRKQFRRFKYIGDKHHNCSLKIHQVDNNDEGTYAFRFIYSTKARCFTESGPRLKVVDLNILMLNPNGDETIKEGDSVSLNCTKNCDDPLSTIIWFKNGVFINEGTVLYLRNVSSTISGNYSCSLKTHEETTSRVIRIDVEFGPKNASVIVTPLAEMDTGCNINITLVCSSHANPPVENYSWFKIADGHIRNVGYQSVLLPGDDGQYLCSVTNKHGSQNSSVVTLKMKRCWATITRDILIIAALAVLLIVIIVAGITRLIKQRFQPPKADGEEEVQNTDYANWIMCDNQSEERGQYEAEMPEVIYATVSVHRKIKPDTSDQRNSQTEDVIYSTVCRG